MKTYGIFLPFFRSFKITNDKRNLCKLELLCVVDYYFLLNFVPKVIFRNE